VTGLRVVALKPTVQDAFVAAAVEWDRRGVPERGGAWLTTTAWRKALDRLRDAAYAPELVADVHYDDLDFDASSLADGQLRMLFTCCHPALAAEARMALTLRSVADRARARSVAPAWRGPLGEGGASRLFGLSERSCVTPVIPEPPRTRRHRRRPQPRPTKAPRAVERLI
jgi:hypothetical protein